MYLHLVSMSRLHPSSLNNFLRSSCFNIELSLPPMCLSIACIHFASYVDFPHWPLHHFLRFVVSISEPPLHQQLLACILSQYLNSSHPVLGPKKHAQVQEKKAPRSKNIQPNVSAYNNGVPPHPMEARSTKQVRGPKKKKPMSETINLAVKKIPWVQHKYMQVKKTNIPTGSRKHTGKSPHIFCAPRSKKNNPGKSKKHVQVQKRVPRFKKHASQKWLHLQCRECPS